MGKLSKTIFETIETDSAPEQPHTIGKFELVRWGNMALGMETIIQNLSDDLADALAGRCNPDNLPDNPNLVGGRARADHEGG